jgi:hypothetical protein
MKITKKSPRAARWSLISRLMASILLASVVAAHVLNTTSISFTKPQGALIC